MKPPAFQFYASDFFTGSVDMSQADVGAYIRLMCHQWTSGCLPETVEKIERVAGGPVSGDVLGKFPVGEDGRRRNNRMELERLKQEEFRAAQSAKGKAGIEKRWSAARSDSTGYTPAIANAIANAIAPAIPPAIVRLYPDHSSSSSSSSSSSVKTIAPPGASPTPTPPPGTPQPSFALDTSAAAPHEREATKTPETDKKPVAAPKRERNVAFDALAECCGIDVETITAKEGARIGTALAEIAKAMAGKSPEGLVNEIHRRASIYPGNMPEGTTITPTALSANWGRCAQPIHRAAKEEPAWAKAKRLDDAIATHPANRNHIAYRAEIVTEEMISDFKRLKTERSQIT